MYFNQDIYYIYGYILVFILHFLGRTLFELFWNVTQHWLVVSYSCVGTAYHSPWGQDQKAVLNCRSLTANNRCKISQKSKDHNYFFGVTTVVLRNKWTLDYKFEFLKSVYRHMQQWQNITPNCFSANLMSALAPCHVIIITWTS